MHFLKPVLFTAATLMKVSQKAIRLWIHIYYYNGAGVGSENKDSLLVYHCAINYHIGTKIACHVRHLFVGCHLGRF